MKFRLLSLGSLGILGLVLVVLACLTLEQSHLEVAAVLLLAGTGLLGWSARAGRRGALLEVVLGSGLAVGVGLWVHETLRGERPDPGPEPVQVAEPPACEALERQRRARVVEPPSFRLIVWGDCRSGVSVQERLADEIRRRRPDLTVGLGDLVGMARRYQFRIVERRFAQTGVPTLYVPGNHDLDPFGTLKPYAAVFGGRNWSCRHRNALLLGLDTAKGVLDPADVTWVEQQLGQRLAGDRHVLLFCHHPLYTPEKHPEKPLPDDDTTKRLRALVEREGLHVFASHYHGYDVQRHGEVTQVTTGGAGARPESDDPYHCVEVEVGDEVRFERIVLAQQDEISERVDRWLVLRDEAAYAVGEFRGAVYAVVAGLALAFAGVFGLLLPRRSDHSTSAKSV